MYEEKENIENEEKKVVISEDSEDFEEPKKKKEIHFDWPSILIKLLILFVFIFFIIFIINKVGKGNKNTLFNKNIETMRAGAYSYFKDEVNRPVEENEEIDITLQDMIDSDMVNQSNLADKLTCNSEVSHISVTKVSDTKYNLDVYLTCGEETRTENYTLNYRSLKNENSSSTAKEEKEETETVKDSSNVSASQVSNDSNKKSSNGSSSSVNSTSSSGSVSENNSKTTLYELSRVIQDNATYSCPDGFTLVGASCYSNIKLYKAKAVPKYQVIPSKKINASYHKDEVEKVYADPIVQTSAASLSCSSGYTLVGQVCQKTVAPTVKTSTSYQCPENTTLSGTKCVKTASLIQKSATYKCSSGTLTNDNRCKVTSSVSVRCKKGTYDSSKKQCYVTKNATKVYTNWRSIGVTSYSSKLKETDYETRRYEYIGVNAYGNYSYRVYTRSFTGGYSCSSGTYAGNGKCHVYSSSYLENYCKSGYTLNSKGTKCVKYTKASVKTKASTSCPSGYTKSGDKCVRYINATPVVQKVSTCPSGYEKTSDNKCMIAKKPVTKEGKTVYSCPSGYEKLGDGSYTKCVKKNVTPGYYYCTDESATLNDKKCITPSQTEFLGYNCPKGYELSGNYCYMYTDSEKVKATKVPGAVLKEEFIWSATKKIDGWNFTGNTKKV